MHIVPLQTAHLDVLRDLYLVATSPVPHCRFMPSEAMFRAALTQLSEDDVRVLVVEEAGTAHGFAALRQLTQKESDPQWADITALFFANDAAGQALLAACEAQICRADIDYILAFPNTHGQCPVPGYNGGWDGLSDRMPATARLLARNGYRPYYRELHMTCDFDRFPPLPNPAPPGITLVEAMDDRGRLTLQAMAESQLVGVCIYGTLDRLSDDLAARRWGYIWGLEVAEAFRRRGIARYLLTSSLAHLHAQGCTGCWLTTGADNWPAQPLYLSLGFEVVDSSACFRKALTPWKLTTSS